MAFVLCDSTHCFSAGTRVCVSACACVCWCAGRTCQSSINCAPSAAHTCALIAPLLEHSAVPGWKTKVTHTITLICLFTLAQADSQSVGRAASYAREEGE